MNLFNNLDIPSETDNSAYIKDILRNQEHHELKDISSYGELLNDIVEDEFELTISESYQGESNMNKIKFNPLELLQKYNTPSMLNDCL
jgi:hypothetical protein